MTPRKDPSKPPLIRGDDVARFWSYVSISESGCWEWLASKDKDGYGRFTLRRNDKAVEVKAHNFAYDLYREPCLFDASLVTDHLCRNTGCCNPWHLERVTVRENAVRSSLTLIGANVRKTHCPKGHEYSGENLRFGSGGQRRCVTCVREQYNPDYHREYYLSVTKPSRKRATTNG